MFTTIFERRGDEISFFLEKVEKSFGFGEDKKGKSRNYGQMGGSDLFWKKGGCQVDFGKFGGLLAKMDFWEEIFWVDNLQGEGKITGYFGGGFWVGI